MTLIRFEPLRDLENFHSRVMRYFDDFPSLQNRATESFSPRIDISEDDNSIFVNTELPGVKKEDIKLTIEDNILTIEGEKKNEDEKKEKNYYRTERVYGKFHRSFTLPVEVDPDKVEAKYEDGTLKISMAKLEEKKAETKQIELK